MKFLTTLLIFALISCASKNDLSLDTRYEIGKAPEMTRKELAIFIAGTLQAADIPVDEKMQIKKEIEVYIAELSILEMNTRRLYAAILKNLGRSKTNEKSKTIKELKASIIKVNQQQVNLKIKLLDLIIKKFNKTTTPEDQEYILEQIYNTPNEVSQNREI